jgi:hypothetical protein
VHIYLSLLHAQKNLRGKKKLLRTTTSSPSSESTYPTYSTSVRWYASAFLNEKNRERKRE